MLRVQMTATTVEVKGGGKARATRADKTPDKK
jgi:hypothetical protein